MLKRLAQRSVDLIPARARSVIKHLPLVGGIQRWLVASFISGSAFNYRVTAGPARGVLFCLRLPDDKGIWTGTYEPIFSRALAKAVRPGYVCYDVGGYHGYMTAVLATAGASAVVVFEPNADNIRALETLAQLNPNLPIVVAPFALGGEDGEAEFHVMGQESMGKIAASSFQTDAIFERSTKVIVRQLDTVLAEREYPPPHLVKIDVEGFEFEVLRGATTTLRRFRPTLFIEVHSDALTAQCADFLRSLGYSIKELSRVTGATDAPHHIIALPE